MSKFISERNLKFLLYNVHDVESLISIPFFEDHDKEGFDIMLDMAMRMANDQLYPFFQEMDRQPPELVDGQIKVHPSVKDYIATYAENGWFTAPLSYDEDGQQLPLTVFNACSLILAAANYGGSVYPGLTIGAANLIRDFGAKELHEPYIENMMNGTWQGTMALTEPDAGSSLSDVATMAYPTDGDHYLIKGQKIFISAGDHDAVDNIVHLMLARIEGAPPGVKGISLFLVPKYRPEGDELVPNDLLTAGIFHKMGYRGCPIAHLSMGEEGDCRGWLVGEAHKGLSYMFQMMNEARIGTGIGATGLASGAYYASLEYAGERPQGRMINDKDLTKPQVMIINHADIKRMLLFQRAVTEGSESLILETSKYADLALNGPEDTKHDYWLLLELLTPVAKTYPSEMGILSISAGVQILGGYGYTDEFILEQYYRDCRIHPIHEGTTGIQGMDLLGRKVMMEEGKALKLFFKEVAPVLAKAAENEATAPYAQRLQQAMDKLQEVVKAKIALAMKGRPDIFLADATLFLEMFGLVVVAWQWLKQGVAAQQGLAGNPSEKEKEFFQGKLDTMRYFFHYELSKMSGLADRLEEDDGLTALIQPAAFND